MEVTDLSKQYYKELQLLTMVDFNVPLIPVRSVNEMAKVVAQLVSRCLYRWSWNNNFPEGIQYLTFVAVK